MSMASVNFFSEKPSNWVEVDAMWVDNVLCYHYVIDGSLNTIHSFFQTTNLGVLLFVGELKHFQSFSPVIIVHKIYTTLKLNGIF